MSEGIQGEIMSFSTEHFLHQMNNLCVSEVPYMPFLVFALCCLRVSALYNYQVSKDVCSFHQSKIVHTSKEIKDNLFH